MCIPMSPRGRVVAAWRAGVLMTPPVQVRRRLRLFAAWKDILYRGVVACAGSVLSREPRNPGSNLATKYKFFRGQQPGVEFKPPISTELPRGIADGLVVLVPRKPRGVMRLGTWGLGSIPR
ncbi:Meiotically up-regulated gene 4 protein [Frankliniella fusca]|uniref:Meiotically up-regulated gene 4 protein n=1 Tax=Frankliniella fusca TaxID=407009 RepID=A0AAE1LQL5_9NEOP|nr:Meiotically up-regulated gene 4 protein [Frankliniella fusca]